MCPLPALYPLKLFSPKGEGFKPGENETEELVRAAQNPIANMISFPIQNNTKTDKRLGAYYNIEKPDNLGPDWTLCFQVNFMFPKGRK